MAALRAAGQSWDALPPQVAGLHAWAISPDLVSVEHRGALPADRFVRVVRAKQQGFDRLAPGLLQATSRAAQPAGTLARSAGGFATR